VRVAFISEEAKPIPKALRTLMKADLSKPDSSTLTLAPIGTVPARI
jgi:hypothetical protein